MDPIDPKASPAEVWIDQLIDVDERLIGSDETQAHTSTAATDESVDQDFTECLELLQRVRTQAEHWPGRADGLEWLYRAELTPAQIGRFRIRRRLGMGGFGIVFLAYDPHLNRNVALKVPRLEAMVSRESQQRFLRESKLAAALAHENIGAVFEAGVIEPVSYIVSAYCPGGSILDFLEQQGGHLPPKAAARLMMALAQAVQHAHGRGVLHRDIKPSNVLLDVSPDLLDHLATDPEQLAHAARLVDFGLARNLEAPHGETALGEDPTRTGAMLGTPAYMAPEQITGDREAVTQSSDIYALGATLYYLLVGQPPFRRPSDWETLQAVRQDEPPVPSGQQENIPRDLDAICLKCLEKEPHDRYRSASDLELDLQRFLNGEPIAARHLTGLQRAARWCRRNPALSGSLVLVLAVLIAATSVSTVLWRRAVLAQQRAEAEEELAVANAQEARKQSGRVRQAVDQLLTAIAEEPSLRSAGMETFREKLLAAANDFYQQLRQDQSTNKQVLSEHVETTSRLASIHRMLGDHTRAVALWREAARDVREFFPEDASRLAFLVGSHAQELEALGQHAAAVELSREALKLQQQATDHQPDEKSQTSLVRVLIHHAQTLQSAGFYAEANERLDEAIGVVEQLTGEPPAEWPPDKLWGILLRDKARALSSLELIDESNQIAIKALDIIETHMQRCPTDRSGSLMHLASLRTTMGHNQLLASDLTAAEQEFRIAHNLAAELVDQHPDVGMLHDYQAARVNQLAKVVLQQGRLAEVRDLLEDNQQRIAFGRQQFADLNSQWEQRAAETSELLELVDNEHETR